MPLNLRRLLVAAALGAALGGVMAQSPGARASSAAQAPMQAQVEARVPTPVLPQAAPLPASSGATAEVPVRLANRTVAVMRGDFLGVGPERRAQRAELVLGDLMSLAGEGRVTVQVEPQGHLLLVDGELVFILTADDVDALRNQTLEEASRSARDVLQLALNETREARSLKRLLVATGISALATLLAVGALFLIARARRFAGAGLTAVLARQSDRVRLGGTPLWQADRLVHAVGVVSRGLFLLLALAVVFEWFSFVLRQYPYTRPWGEGLTRFAVERLQGMGRGVLDATPDLVVAVLIFTIARGVLLAFRPFFDRVAAAGRSPRAWLDADTARPTQRLFTVGVALFAVVMAYPYLPGSGSEAFKGISVLVGVMITIGGSSLFSQVASGVVLMYSRTLRVGEYVQVNGHEGTVTEMGAFTTRIRTGLGEELTLPNAMVLGTVTKNYSRVVSGPGYVVDTTVTIGYDTPWRQVEAMLLEAARRTPGVVDTPPPRVFQTALSDFYPEYRLVAIATPSEPRPRAQVLSSLHANIQDVFNEHGVQIMSPHYVSDPAGPKVVPREAWYTAPARREDGSAAASSPGTDRPA